MNLSKEVTDNNTRRLQAEGTPVLAALMAQFKSGSGAVLPFQ